MGAKQYVSGAPSEARASVVSRSEPHEPMKKLTKTLLALGFASALLTTTAFGQAAPYNLKIDESGNGTLTGLPVGPVAIQGVLGQDPVSGIVTLCYDLTSIEIQFGFNF